MVKDSNKRYRRATFGAADEQPDIIEETPMDEFLSGSEIFTRQNSPMPSSSRRDFGRKTKRRARPILGVEGEAFFSMSQYTDETGMVSVHRPVYSHRNFTQEYQEKFVDTIFVPEMKRPNCSKKYCQNLLYRVFPIVHMTKNYNWRQNLPIDIISGLTTAIMRIPQSMAYAFLANLRPETGLYTAFIAAVFYIIFGGSNHIVVGCQGVISIMVGGVVERTLVNKYHVDVNNISMTNSSQMDVVAAVSSQTAATVTFLAGAFQLGLGLFQLGFVTNYLSDPLIGGFTTGAACQVLVSQIDAILGIPDVSGEGLYKVFETLVQLFGKIGETNYVTVLISIYALTLLASVKYFNGRLKPRFPIPGELIVMVTVILFSYLTDAGKLWGVKVVGNVPAGFQTPVLPSVSLMSEVIDVGFSSAIVSFAIGYSVAKRLALKHDYEISGNQEVFAFGVMNCATSFFNGFVATGTLSVSSLHDSLGGKSQFANIIASIVVLFVILFLGFLFEPVPDCVLSAIILVNLKSILSQFLDLKVLWRVSKIDFLLWLVTWAAVVILDVDVGLLIGVTFSLLTIVFRTQWPYVCELGRIPSTDLYKNRNITPEALTIDGIRIVRFEGSLYFASAEHFRQSLYKETNCNPHKIIYGRQQFATKIQKLRSALQLVEEGTDKQSGADNEKTQLLKESTLPPDTFTTLRREVHHIIIDFSTCSFMDSVGVRTLNQCIAEYKDAGISLYLANVRAAVRSILFHQMGELVISSKMVFLSVHDAVLAALESAQRLEEIETIIVDAVSGKASQLNVSRISTDCETPY